MRLPLPWLVVALVLAAPLRADTTPSASTSSDPLLPPPNTWSIGFHGFGPFYPAGQPSVRYVLNQDWAFELTPNFSYNHEHSSAVQTSSERLLAVHLDFLRTLTTYKGLKLSALVEPGFRYDYTRTDSQPFDYSKTTIATFDLNAGLELEYFLRRDLSVAARTIYAFNWARDPSSTSSTMIRNAHTAAMAIDGETFALHYYFEGPSDEAPVSKAGPGSWAIGWAGVGNLYSSDYQPSLKYVWSEKTAFEIIPKLSWQHSNNGGTYNHNQSFTVPFDVERKVMTRGPVVISAVIEPSIGTAYFESKSTPFYTQQKAWTFGLGVGPELEYFVRPNISVGARALLAYSGSYQSNYSQAGYGGMQIAHNVFLAGQVLNAHWYFGGKRGGS